MIKGIRMEFPKIPIWVGGQAFRWGGRKVLDDFEHTLFIDSIYNLEKQLEEIS
jgi:hypothetical protein